MVKVQGIVERNKNAHHRAKKMKPKDYRAETYQNGFCTKINASRAVCTMTDMLQNVK